MSTAKEKDTVKVHYTGSLASGEVFDSSLEVEPIEFEIGAGNIIPGFENAVIGMQVDEKKTITIPADEAYGQVEQELIQKIPSDSLPEEIKPEVGMELVSKTPDGEEIPVTVMEVADDHIVVDANHPLAGQDLTFEIQLVEIK